jgi:carbon monoxide dehydrogenase subunit G/mannose-6-phosphate isomerase-like protein (cupin superfamily)
MRFDRVSTVRAPIDRLWDFMIDGQAVSACMPGVEEFRAFGDEVFEGRVRLSFGPISLALVGTITVAARDRANWTACMNAVAKDVRIAGDVMASFITQLVARSSDETELRIAVDAKVLGKLGEFGQPMIKKTVEKYLGSFVDNISAALAEQPPEEMLAPLPSDERRNAMSAVLESDLDVQMEARIGRHANKVPDWDAFPASRGYPELDRAQIRYIGAGGSPKIDDPGTLKPEHFTLSMVMQPVGKYGASHAHEVEEAFLVLEGVLTIGWEWDGEVILARAGPRDMVLHATGRPHGFKNEGFGPVLLSIMVGKGKPMPPNYKFHPRTHSPEVSASFGAAPGKTVPLSFTSDDPRHRQMASYFVRYSQQKPQWNPAGFARLVYIGEGGAPAGTFRKDLIVLPKGNGVRAYERDVEDAYLVLQGCITVGWEAEGKVVEKRLGPRDLICTPAGQPRYFRNDGVEDAHFMMVVGTPNPESVKFQAR